MSYDDKSDDFIKGDISSSGKKISDQEKIPAQFNPLSSVVLNNQRIYSTSNAANIEIDSVNSGFRENDNILADYLYLFRKFRYLILAITSAFFIVSFFYALLATPIYSSSAKLKIEEYTPLLVSSARENYLSEKTQSSSYLNTQIELLTSNTLADKVLSADEKSSGIVEYVKKNQSFLKKLFASSDESEEILLEEEKIGYSFSSDFLEEYLELIGVEHIEETSLVTLTASTSSPELSAKIANLHAKYFIELVKEERQRLILENLIFLKKQAEELEDKIALSEKNIAAYKEENSIVTLSKDETIVTKKIAELDTLLTKATAKRIEAESAYQQAKLGIDTAVNVLGDNFFRDIQAEINQAEAEYAKLSQKFKPTYPKMKQLKAKVKSLKSQLTVDKKEYVKVLESNYKSSLEAEEAKKQELEIEKSKAFELSRGLVEYKKMDREYESSKDLYQNVLKQLKEAQMSSQNSGSNIIISDLAAVPVKHSSPKRLKIILFSLFIGFAFSIFATFIMNAFDNSFKNQDEVERYLTLPTIGVVPSILSSKKESIRIGLEEEMSLLENTPISEVSTEDLSEGNAPSVEVKSNELQLTDKNGGLVRQDELVKPGEEPNLLSVTEPFSVFSESIKSIRTSIMLSTADYTPKVMLVTSGTKNEGKTTVISNLAVTLAQFSSAVLLIDADLRKPSLDKRFSLPRKNYGLVDYLAGMCPMGDALYESEAKNLFVMPAGSRSPNPTELLGSNKMEEFLKTASETFDFILIDVPPVLPVSDALLLSRVVDAVLLVIRSERTQRQIAKNAHQRLKQVGANVLGVVLNDVDLENNYYYYGGAYSYYGT